MADSPLTHRLRLRPFGAQVTIVADDERFLAAAAFRLGRYPTPVGLALRVRISAKTLPPDLGSAVALASDSTPPDR